MRAYTLISLSLLVSSCGAYEEQKADSANANNETAYLVAKLDDMPNCTKEIEGRLIYIEDSNQFFSCSKTEWTEININGKDGKDGKDGEDGLDGKNGIAGRNGEDGQDGEDGRDGINGIAGRDGHDGQNGRDGAGGNDAPYVSEKDWIHPVTGVKWFIGGIVSNTWTSSVIDRPQMGEDNYLCPEGSHPPDEAEYRDAFKAGLWSKISSITVPVVAGGVIDSTQNNNGVIIKFYRFRYARSTGMTDLLSTTQYPTGFGAFSGTSLCIVDE